MVVGKIYLDIEKFDIVTTGQVKFVIFEKKKTLVRQVLLKLEICNVILMR